MQCAVSVAFIADERADTSSRNIYRHADLCDAVEMGKVKDHFIFTIESVGAVRAQKLFVDAIDLMREKIDSTRDAVEKLLADL
jgi:DNA-directed RNA polymerase I and III subunit RPAC1